MKHIRRSSPLPRVPPLRLAALAFLLGLAVPLLRGQQLANATSCAHVDFSEVWFLELEEVTRVSGGDAAAEASRWDQSGALIQPGPHPTRLLGLSEATLVIEAESVLP
jgi:hypothetical protein